MTAMKRREKSPAKREVILNGAITKFLAHGFAETTMDQIASAAGVSKATVYAHFGDKEHLFDALIQRLAQEKVAALLTVIEAVPPERSPAEVLSMVFDVLLREMGGDFETISFLRLLITESSRLPTVTEIFARTLEKPIVEWLTTYLASHPELRLADPEAVAWIVFALIHHRVIVYHLLGNQEINPMASERLVAALIALITERDSAAGYTNVSRTAMGTGKGETRERE